MKNRKPKFKMGELMRLGREIRGLSIQDAAKLAGIAPATISRIEDEYPALFGEVVAYARVVRVSLDRLAECDGATREGADNDVAELVSAARVVAYEDQSQEALDRLDRASEAFAERVPWDDNPTARVPTQEA